MTTNDMTSYSNRKALERIREILQRVADYQSTVEDWTIEALELIDQVISNSIQSENKDK